MRVFPKDLHQKGVIAGRRSRPSALAFRLETVTQWTPAQCFFLLADFLVVLLPLAFDFELVLPLPLTAPCRPFTPWLERGSARGLADGTGSFQPNASIWLPT